MQDTIMPQVVRKRQWNTGVGRGENNRSTGQAERGRFEHPLDKLVFALAQRRPLALEQKPAGSPGQHRKATMQASKSGNQPPSNSLALFAATKIRSTRRKNPLTAATANGL